METALITLIQESDYLNPLDKEFLIESLNQMDKLEKLKLQQNLKSYDRPVILKQLEIIKNKFQVAQKQATTPDPITKFVQKFIPAKDKKPLSYSVFSKPDMLGSKPPTSISSAAPKPPTINAITDPAQLAFLNVDLIDSISHDGAEQKRGEFLQVLSQLFSRIDDINMRRNYFLTYMKSQLFTAYISTGLTAMKHEELKPRTIALNLLYQIDQKYLNSRQFKTTAEITNHLKNLCAL